MLGHYQTFQIGRKPVFNSVHSNYVFVLQNLVRNSNFTSVFRQFFITIVFSYHWQILALISSVKLYKICNYISLNGLLLNSRLDCLIGTRDSY